MTRALLALALLVTPLAAPAASRVDESAARAAFERGRMLHDAGRYHEAIVEYEAAYQLLPLPEFLFNIGQCYRLAGEDRLAVDYYRRYLTLLARGGAADDARAHIARLAPEPRVAPPPVVDRPRRSPWRWVGLGMTGGGIVAVSAGVWFRFEAAAGAKELAAARGQYDADLARIDRERIADGRRMWIFAGVGAGLIAAGILTFVLSGRDEDAPRITPHVGPGTAALTLSGRL